MIVKLPIPMTTPTVSLMMKGSAVDVSKTLPLPHSETTPPTFLQLPAMEERVKTVSGLHPLSLEVEEWKRKRRKLEVWWRRPRTSSPTRRCGNLSHTPFVSLRHPPLYITIGFNNTHIFFITHSHEMIKLVLKNEKMSSLHEPYTHLLIQVNICQNLQ